MIQVASYCRVSTDKEDQANSFAAQKRYFREYIRERSGWELYEIYADEGITGTTTQKRTQFNRMMNDAYAGKFQMIVTKEVSRFSRNILDTIAYTRELRAMGIGVIFVTDRINTLEPEAEMLLSYLASMAQEESRRTSARVVWGQTRQMERGVVFGQSLLGYDLRDGVLTVNEGEAELVRLIFHKYAMEQMSTTRIARYLEEKGYLTHRGGEKWTASGIVRILRNEKYVGDLVQKKSYTPDFLTHAKKYNHGQVPLVTIEDHHAPIVDREVWNLAQARLRKNDKHNPAASGHSNRYVFSGKIRCGQCGAGFVGRTKTLQNGTKIRRWSCGTVTSRGRLACDVGKLVRDDDAVQMLKTALQSLPADMEAIVRNVTALALDAVRSTTDREVDREQLLRRIGKLLEKKEALLDSYFSREISREEMQSMKQRYEQQHQALRKKLEEAEKLPQSPEKDRSAAIAGEVTALLRGETESEVLYKTLLESLTVFKDRHMELRLKELPFVFHFA